MAENATTTKLEAVNTMLSAIQEAPVSSLDSTAVDDVALAVSILEEVVKELCMQPWDFNTETEYTLNPNNNDEVVIPSDAVAVDVTPEHQGTKHYIVKGGKLYDKVAHSYEITAPIKVNLVWLMEWDELPEEAKRLCLIRAARILAARVLDDQSAVSYTLLDEQKAERNFRRAESATGDYSLFNSFGAIYAARRQSVLGQLRTR